MKTKKQCTVHLQLLSFSLINTWPENIIGPLCIIQRLQNQNIADNCLLLFSVLCNKMSILLIFAVILSFMPNVKNH